MKEQIDSRATLTHFLGPISEDQSLIVQEQSLHHFVRTQNLQFEATIQAVFDELRGNDDHLSTAQLPAAMRLLGMNPTKEDALRQQPVKFLTYKYKIHLCVCVYIYIHIHR